MGAFEPFAIVDLSAAQILQAHRIDQQFDAEILDQGVAVLNLLVELEAVLQTGTPTALHEDPQFQIGIAFGFDRLCAIFGGSDSIRDYIAFPKNNSGRDTMIDAPSPLNDLQLKELGIKLR